MGPWVVPGYTEVRELGRDAAGRVMLAWHDPTGTPVAIRYLSEALRADDEFLRACRMESQRLSEVDSPHITRYYEYVESAGGVAIVMELVDGVSVRAILDEGGPLDPLAASIVLRDSLLGLAAAHARGVLHGDPRPEHVLVDTEGRAKLIATGLAARASAGRSTSVRSDLHAVAATFRRCLDGPQASPRVLGRLADLGAAAAEPGRPADAKALLAELTAAACDVFGPGWEQQGRDALAARAARLLHVPAAPGPLAPHAGKPRWPGKMLVAVALALVAAAALAALLTR